MLNVQFVTETTGLLDRLTRLDEVDAVFLEHALPTEEQYQWLEFLSIHTGGQPGTLLPALEAIDDASLILDSVHVTEDDVVSVLICADEPDRHVLTTLTETGCVPFRVEAAADGLHVGGIVENWNVLKTVGDALEADQRDFDLVSVTETDSLHRPFDESRMKHVVQDSLTASQFALLETAYETGYFHVPKNTTSQELAERLEMSQSTLSEQLRTAQAELYRLIFDMD